MEENNDYDLIRKRERTAEDGERKLEGNLMEIKRNLRQRIIEKEIEQRRGKSKKSKGKSRE